MKIDRNRTLLVAAVLWGVVPALWLARGFCGDSPEAFFRNHESDHYACRLLEFRDLLAAGYLSPQWCSHFRGGLGEPYFSFYQPGFFYLASIVPWSVPPVAALGVAVFCLALAGYLGMLALVRREFGTLPAWLAANGLLLSSYAGTEVYVRGDLSEFSAMMVLPAVLWALIGWLRQQRSRHAVGLALGSGALIVLHPPVALISFLLCGMALTGFLCLTRQWRATLAAAVALTVGVGLAAFYWLPLFGEWDLLSAEKAFTGFYHYSQHYVNPLALLGPYDRGDTIPLSLGPILPELALLNLVALIAWKRKATAGQQWLVISCVLSLLVLTALMTRAAAPVWDHAPLIGRLQFPWRILAVVTVLLAAAAGAMLPWRSEPRRALVMAVLVLALGALSRQYTAHEVDPAIAVPQDVEQLVKRNFAPDLYNECLPRGANPDLAKRPPGQPRAGEGCRVDSLHRDQGRLSCRVRTERASSVVLPHYFYPVGFRAELDGQPAPIGVGPGGLMRVDLPAGTDAVLEVTFRCTPLRRLGLTISGASLIIGVGLMIASRTQIQSDSE